MVLAMRHVATAILLALVRSLWSHSLPNLPPKAIDKATAAGKGQDDSEPYIPNYCNNTDLISQFGLQRSPLGQFLGWPCSNEFFHCRWQSDGYRTYRKHCRRGLVYDTQGTQNCNYDYNVKACGFDGTDLAKCKDKDFTCPLSEKCVPMGQRCDGTYDCVLEEDEQNCPMCGPSDFPCVISEQCIPMGQRCNGILECQDGTDEQDCENCGEGKFKCLKSGKCIAGKLRCDGIPQCTHGEDELLCKKSSSSPSSQLKRIYACENGGQQRLHSEQVCDGVEDCPDGSDERYCKNKIGGSPTRDVGTTEPASFPRVEFKATTVPKISPLSTEQPRSDNLAKKEIIPLIIIKHSGPKDYQQGAERKLSVSSRRLGDLQGVMREYNGGNTGSSAGMAQVQMAEPKPQTSGGELKSLASNNVLGTGSIKPLLYVEGMNGEFGGDKSSVSSSAASAIQVNPCSMTSSTTTTMKPITTDTVSPPCFAATTSKTEPTLSSSTNPAVSRTEPCREQLYSSPTTPPSQTQSSAPDREVALDDDRITKTPPQSDEMEEVETPASTVTKEPSPPKSATPCFTTSVEETALSVDTEIGGKSTRDNVMQTTQSPSLMTTHLYDFANHGGYRSAEEIRILRRLTAKYGTSARDLLKKIEKLLESDESTPPTLIPLHHPINSSLRILGPAGTESVERAIRVTGRPIADRRWRPSVSGELQSNLRFTTPSPSYAAAMLQDRRRGMRRRSRGRKGYRRRKEYLKKLIKDSLPAQIPTTQQERDAAASPRR